MRLQFGAFACAMAVLMSARTLAQAPPESKSEATPPERTTTELFTAPRFKNIDSESVSSSLYRTGWVELAFMLGTSGKPFEVTVCSIDG